MTVLRADELIEKHIDEWVGPPSMHFQMSEDPMDPDAISIIGVEPDSTRPYWTFVTCGMHRYPQNTGGEMTVRTELAMCLPDDWPINDKTLEDETTGWPFYWLLDLAKYPREANTFFMFDQCVPNGDPPEPIADTNFVGFMFQPTLLMSQEFAKLAVNEEESIYFLSLYPLYESELALCAEDRMEELVDLLFELEVSELIDVSRPPMVEVEE